MLSFLLAAEVVRYCNTYWRNYARTMRAPRNSINYYSGTAVMCTEAIDNLVSLYLYTQERKSLTLCTFICSNVLKTLFMYHEIRSIIYFIKVKGFN